MVENKFKENAKKESKFDENVRKMSEEDPLRTLTMFLKYKFPVRASELNIMIENAERYDYFKTHKILIEYKKEKLNKPLFNKLLKVAENQNNNSTQMLVLFEIGKEYIEQNPGIDFATDKSIQKLIKLSPISLNFLDLPNEVNYAICNSLKESEDVEIVASLLKSKCMDEKGFKQIKKDLINTFRQNAKDEDYELVYGLNILKDKGTKFEIATEVAR